MLTQKYSLQFMGMSINEALQNGIEAHRAGNVQNQEEETRRLLCYLGVGWNDACLEPQKNKRIVKTASQRQVRKKAYKGSSKLWKKYERFLGGAFDSLEKFH